MGVTVPDRKAIYTGNVINIQGLNRVVICPSNILRHRYIHLHYEYMGHLLYCVLYNADINLFGSMGSYMRYEIAL